MYKLYAHEILNFSANIQSSRLHEMSPQLNPQQHSELGITAEMTSWMNGESK